MLRDLLFSVLIAFAFFSIIPMPKIDWTDKRMKTVPLIMPLVGLVNGFLAYLLFSLLYETNIPFLLKGIFLTLYFVIFTGGIHIDGLMDTSDAYFSRRDRSHRLDILKDPHVGPFAVIVLVFVIMIKVTVLGSFFSRSGFDPGSIIFIPVISRIIQALMLYLLKPAKKEGLADTFHKRSPIGSILLILLFFLTSFLIFQIFGTRYLIIPLSALIYGIIFTLSAKRQFGGTTGDLLGAFLEISELIMLITLIFV